MENEFELKPFDKVLVRDKNTKVWVIDIFEKYEDSTSGFCYNCMTSLWKQCIPYKGNEHLLGTTDSSERNDIDKNTLFGVKLKSGYVLELEDDEVGILFPTANGFAISYTKGCWQSLNDIEKDTIVKIFGIAKNGFIRSGELLWEKPNPKVIFTKAQIAEKLNLNVNDFEITD